MPEVYVQLLLAPSEKRCGKCREVKPLEAFGKDKQRGSGLKSECKECRRQDGKAYHAANRDKMIAYGKRYREKNREQRRQKRAEQHAANSEQERAYYREYRAKNAALLRERRRVWRQANPDKQKQSNLNWVAANRDRVVLASQRRRAWKRRVPSNLTRQEWRATLAYFGGHCAYCGEPFAKLEQEHMHPLSRGGPHVTANVVPACRTCNARKGDKTLAEFLLAF